jgi:cytosine/adenosine deaminase-related metal-dependent hydrolase
MATIEGARVLGLDKEAGSLEPGKQADLIRVSLAAPRLHPIYDPYSALVFAAMPGDVTDSMVAGRWLMRDREVQTLEPKKVMRNTMQLATEFRAEMVRIDGVSQ